MQRPKRVLCIMDMAGVGRASMAAVLPVLSACGVQACPLPPVLFSTHTGGFGQAYVTDTVAFAAEALSHYVQQQIEFDSIYIGYLRSREQLYTAAQALNTWPQAFKVVDPALADGGQLYSGITREVVNEMAKLCKSADLITPNVTESAFLLGENPKQPPQDIPETLKRLSASGSDVLITSVPLDEGKGMQGCGAGYTNPYTIKVTQVPQSYPGTGDAFTAALIGHVLAHGEPVYEAAKKAAAFIYEAALATYEGGGEPRHGLWFEAFLPLLAQ